MSSTVPKVGFRWEPFDRQFTVRGNYSKSFSAPSLHAEYGPTDTRQVGPDVLQGVTHRLDERPGPVTTAHLRATVELATRMALYAAGTS